MTTQRPEMGNGGLYSFAYIYLTGNPVIGEALVRRGLLALVGYFICGAILFAKHRHKQKTVRFHQVLQKFDLSAPVHLWQFRMALGVSLVLTAGQVFQVERFMWMGFCTDYRYKTAMNCFGALMLATGIYGLGGAVILRIVDTCLGVTFGLVFAMAFHRLAAVRLLPGLQEE